MPVLENPRARLLELIVAFRQTQCVRVAVELGVADQLAPGPAASGTSPSHAAPMSRSCVACSVR